MHNILKNKVFVQYVDDKWINCSVIMSDSLDCCCVELWHLVINTTTTCGGGVDNTTPCKIVTCSAHHVHHVHLPTCSAHHMLN